MTSEQIVWGCTCDNPAALKPYFIHFTSSLFTTTTLTATTAFQDSDDGDLHCFLE